MSVEWTRDLDEAGVVRLAQLLALKIRKGDVIALRGDLGAGKTTLARALIAALLGDEAAEVPSPTFSLSQIYVTPRLTIAHFDFYRLGAGGDARGVGFVGGGGGGGGGAAAGEPHRGGAGRDGRCDRATRHRAGPRRDCDARAADWRAHDVSR